MPKGNASNEEIIEEEDKTLSEVHLLMGQDIDKIYEIIVKNIKT